MAHIVVLSGGGTGGHIFPALALADVIRKFEPSAVLHFIGTERGVGTRYIRDAGYTIDAVASAPLVGRGIVQKFRGLLTLLRGTLQARRVLRRIGATLVIGVGGYASVPAVLAAKSLGLPTALIEPDAAPGRANRLLGKLADAVFAQFEDALRHFPAGRASVTGFPVREIPDRIPPDPGGGVRLLVLGGSQGARSINHAIIGCLDSLAEMGVRVTHQTGPRDFEETRAAYAAAGFVADVAPFFDDMPQRLARADLVVGRAGASSVAEFCRARLPQILVPYPFAAGGHQAQNALEIERVGASIVVMDEAVGSELGGVIRSLVFDREKRERMSVAANRRAAPEAAQLIWERCLGLLGR